MVKGRTVVIVPVEIRFVWSASAPKTTFGDGTHAVAGQSGARLEVVGGEAALFSDAHLFEKVRGAAVNGPCALGQVKSRQFRERLPLFG